MSSKTSTSCHPLRERLLTPFASVRFAPITQPAGDIYTSPSLRPQDKRAPRTPARQPTVSERITARLREFRLNASTGTNPESGEEHKPDVQFDADADAEDKGTPKVDKGKARAVDTDEGLLASPPPMSPPLPPAKIVTDLAPQPQAPAAPVVVAGVSFAAHELSELLTRAKGEMPLRAVRFPLLGEYQDAFSGEEFTAWLRQNVKQYEGDLDRCEDAARELTEKLGLLRRLGEFGNEYEDVDDAFYQFRPKASVVGGSCDLSFNAILFRRSPWKFRRLKTRSCSLRSRRILALWRKE